jgi:hypothetical protein
VKHDRVVDDACIRPELVHHLQDGRHDGAAAWDRFNESSFFALTAWSSGTVSACRREDWSFGP